MQSPKKFAFDVGTTFFASVVTLPLGLVITIALGRYIGTGDLGLYRMPSTLYGIAMLAAAIGIPAAMIKNLSFKKKALPKKQYSLYVVKFNQILSSAVITFLFLGNLSSLRGTSLSE